MKNHLYILFLALVFIQCMDQKNSNELDTDETSKSNISNEVLSELTWLNEPKFYPNTGGSLFVGVSKGTDFFNNPEDSTISGNAPFLYKEMAGDFVAKALVDPDFSSQWNAVSLMMHIDSLNWIKFAFENSDATGPGIVTVVTKGMSDDANGVVLNGQDEIWLAMVRKGNIYSMHWSTDGEKYNMARLTSMSAVDTLKVGVEFQSPVGDSATHILEYFEVVEKTVENMRDLNN